MIIETGLPNNKLTKYIVEKDNGIYFVYVSVDTENYTEFYLQKYEYGIIEFEMGFIIDSNNIMEYINIQIDNWIENYEEILEKLEN